MKRKASSTRDAETRERIAAILKEHGGFAYQKPRIQRITFPAGKIKVELEDGRTVIADLKHFPDMQKLTPQQRRKHGLLGGEGLMFRDLDTVYHVSDFLGRNNSSR